MEKKDTKAFWPSHFIRKYVFFLIFILFIGQAFEWSVCFSFCLWKSCHICFVVFADKDEVGRMVDKFWSMCWSVLGEIRNTKLQTLSSRKETNLIQMLSRIKRTKIKKYIFTDKMTWSQVQANLFFLFFFFHF